MWTLTFRSLDTTSKYCYHLVSQPYCSRQIQSKVGEIFWQKILLSTISLIFNRLTLTSDQTLNTSSTPSATWKPKYRLTMWYGFARKRADGSLSLRRKLKKSTRRAAIKTVLFSTGSSTRKRFWRNLPRSSKKWQLTQPVAGV